MKRDMTSGNVTVSLMYFIVPLTLGNILQQLYNVVDTYIVGRYVGSMALSAVGSVSNLIYIFNAIVLGLKAGISVICSESFGRKDEEDFNISRAVGFSLIVIS
ncbi:MAG: MATE family efflux transporter, partial [Pseudobutyrivibrio sp.]|nr:MATE family efflux transporter [Pseudobutyrivibrio sp.]